MLCSDVLCYDVPTLDFSGCELPPLDEHNLSEPDGIGQSCPEGRMTGYYSPFTRTLTGVPVDWNHDGDYDDTGVAADINNDGKLTVLHGHDDWSNLNFGQAITPSSATSMQQNQTTDELLEAKKPDHFDYSPGQAANKSTSQNDHGGSIISNNENATNNTANGTGSYNINGATPDQSMPAITGSNGNNATDNAANGSASNNVDGSTPDDSMATITNSTQQMGP